MPRGLRTSTCQVSVMTGTMRDRGAVRATALLGAADRRLLILAAIIATGLLDGTTGWAQATDPPTTAGSSHRPAVTVPWLEQVQQPPTALPAVALSPLWSTEDPSARKVSDWQQRREELRRLWQEFLGPRPESASNVIVEIRAQQVDGVERVLIEYETEPGERVQAYLLKPLKPPSEQRLPGLVALHQTTSATIDQVAGVTDTGPQALGWQLAQQGFVVLCPRNFLWQDADTLVAATERFQRRHPQTKGMHKMLFDAQRAVDILAALPVVDPQRLGAVGHSLGAKEVLYLVAFDERIRAAVASEGGVGLTFTNWDAPWYLGPDIRRPDFARNHHELLALAAPRALLILGGEAGPGAADGDRTWPYVAAALPIYQRFGSPARLGLLNHRQGHSLPNDAVAKLSEWLQVHLSAAEPRQID
jgi:hypothetical protein